MDKWMTKIADSHPRLAPPMSFLAHLGIPGQKPQETPSNSKRWRILRICTMRWRQFMGTSKKNLGDGTPNFFKTLTFVRLFMELCIYIYTCIYTRIFLHWESHWLLNIWKGKPYKTIWIVVQEGWQKMVAKNRIWQLRHWRPTRCPSDFCRGFMFNIRGSLPGTCPGHMVKLK